MTLGIDTVTFDCADPMRLATFWAEALGFEIDADSDPDGAFVEDPTRGTRGLFFQPVPEPKVAKNRVHLDVRPTESMAAEVARLEALGASVVGRVDVEGTAEARWGSFWTVMLDPEGNEFCILRGPEDGWTPPSDE